MDSPKAAMGAQMRSKSVKFADADDDKRPPGKSATGVSFSDASMASGHDSVKAVRSSRTATSTWLSEYYCLRPQVGEGGASGAAQRFRHTTDGVQQRWRAAWHAASRMQVCIAHARMHV